MSLSQWLRRLTESKKPNTRAARRLSVGLDVLEGRLVFSVFVVNSLADAPLASLGGDGKLQLREAIQLATHPNTTIDGYSTSSLTNTIQFAPSLDGAAINLIGAGDSAIGPAAFGVTGSAQLTIDGAAGLSKGVTIGRPDTFSQDIGGTTYTASVPAFRLATVRTGSALTLKGLTIRGFIAKGNTGGGGDVAATGGGSAGVGGVVWNQGTLSIVDSTLTGNTAQGGAGGSLRVIYHTLLNGSQDRSTSDSGSGGAGLNGGGADALWENEGGGAGGGPDGGVGGNRPYPDGRGGNFGGGGGGGYGSNILADYGNAGAGGVFGGGGGGASGSDAFWDSGSNGGNGGFGGGGGGGFKVGQPHGGLSGVGGEFGGNASLGVGGGGAGLGGAIFNWGGTVTVTNSTLTGNSALGGAGGTDQSSTNRGSAGKGGGAAIASINGSLTVNNSTISGNTSSDEARGVVVIGISGGTARAVFNNTIIGQAGASSSDFDLLAAGLGGTATVGGQNNLIGNLFTDAVSGLTGTLTGDPKLGPLQDNGGPTPTMAPLAGSPLIDAGSNAAVPAGVTTDQRGSARVVNNVVDIGAVEAVQKQAQTISFNALANRTYGDADFALGATSSSGLPVSFVATGDATVSLVDGVWYAHITGAGTATIAAVQDGNDNFLPADAVEQTFAIAKAATTTTTLATGPYTYSGQAFIGGTGTVAGPGDIADTAILSYSYSANADGTGTADLVNAGTYYVAATFAGNANYLPSSGARIAIVINKANATVNVAGYTGTYDGLAHGATGTAVGVDGTSVGTLNLGATFTNVPGGTANWTFDGGQNYVSRQGSVAVQILAKHITGSFTATNKTYDGTTAATVTSRTLDGVVGTDAVTLNGGKAAFNSKYAGKRTVILYGATLGGAAAGNYVLDAVATTTATINAKPLAAAATTQPSTNAAMNGPLPVRVVVNRVGIVDGQSVAQLFDGAYFTLAVCGRTYSVRAVAKVVGNAVEADFRMTSELKAILAASTKATSAGKATTVALNLTAKSKDGNYTLAVSAFTKLFNTAK